MNSGLGDWKDAAPEAYEEDVTLDDRGEWLPTTWSYRSATDASVSGPSGVESVPETIVIIGGQRAGKTAIAEERASQQSAAAKQIRTIHPDHTAHWQDEARDCQWCRDEAA